ncbi:hypothetical protein PGH26_07750 [Sporosarcina jeotgali]|uniref:Uncharacterized protein n=1 Tax=Sporosarcina jeotgali TaxID=3020056 RepID=A0ABZ0KZY9_9BACL|nr:hypothetical protein [Sporosarcina sp. B2O-1]WOV85816.1 hypothetical protein PGH26_07750 [Sporosarcina sp. B2O-1]
MAVIVIALLVLYSLILFRNGIEMHDVMLEYTVLFLLSSFLIVVLWKVRRTLSKSIKAVFTTLLVMQVSFISYEAYVQEPKYLSNEQNKLLLLLAGSSDYQQLNLTSEDLQNVHIIGDPKQGGFDHPFDYIVEITTAKNQEVFQFSCKGNGPACEELGFREQVLQQR